MKYLFNEKGPHIKLLQQRLIRSGYKLPAYGADGHLGEETFDVLKLYARDQNLVWEPMLPEDVTSLLMERGDATSPNIPSPRIATGDAILDAVRFIDLRKDAGLSHPKSRIIGGRTVRRNHSVVYGITLHQMAIALKPSRALIREANGDRELALAMRGARVAAPICAFPGMFSCSVPLDWYMYHGNRLNRPTLGIEVSGLFSGLLDDPDTPPREDLRTTWKGEPDELTDEIIAGARAAVRFAVIEGRSEGMPIQYAYAHRQSNGKKPGDPGEGLWRAVITEYAVPVLGLEPVYGFTVDEGRPIPKEWDDLNGVGHYR